MVTPLIVPEKFAAVRDPPLSLMTTLLMIRCAAWLVLVIVHVLVSSLRMVPEQPEYVVVYPAMGVAFSTTLNAPAGTSSVFSPFSTSMPSCKNAVAAPPFTLKLKSVARMIPPLVLTARLPLGAIRPSSTKGPPSPFLQKPRSSRMVSTVMLKES